MSESKQLAIQGANPIQPEALPHYISLGQEEKDAVLRVMEGGILSGFVAAGDERFYGGKLVREFEEQFAGMHEAQFGVSFNSATSGLVAAVGALDLGYGDEVIVPAQTMSASAACVLAYNAVPVFADVDARTFNLDPASVRERISEKTRALIVVHLYGHPAPMDELLQIAREHNLKIIEDCAQSPLTRYKGKFTGNFGDIGVFSLNIHKHINSGEGGIAITNDPELRERLALIRNHGEVKGNANNLSNTIGWNLRFTELQAAIAIEQTRKLPALVQRKRELAARLCQQLSDLDWVQTPEPLTGCEHGYYDFPLGLQLGQLNLSKQEFMRITATENLPITESYRPIYWLPIYQQKICYGKEGFPFDQLSPKNADNYENGSCPVAERMFERDCLTFEICSYDVNEEHIDRIAEMFRRIDRMYK